MTDYETVRQIVSNHYKDSEGIIEKLNEYWSLTGDDEIKIEKIWIEVGDRFEMTVSIADILTGHACHSASIEEQFIADVSKSIYNFLTGA